MHINLDNNVVKALLKLPVTSDSIDKFDIERLGKTNGSIPTEHIDNSMMR